MQRFNIWLISASIMFHPLPSFPIGKLKNIPCDLCFDVLSWKMSMQDFQTSFKLGHGVKIAWEDEKIRQQMFGDMSIEEAKNSLEEFREPFRDKFGKYVGLKRNRQMLGHMIVFLASASYTWFLEFDNCEVSRWCFQMAQEFHGDAAKNNSLWNQLQKFLDF